MKAYKCFRAGESLTLLAAAIMLLLVGCKPSGNQEGPELPLPEWKANRPTINVEQLKDHIDLDMDLSQLSLSELRVLRNAFAARQGYIFMSAELRNIFEQTTWYEQLMYERWAYEEGCENWLRDEEDGASSIDLSVARRPISYTKEEEAFIERVKAREAELLKRNFVIDDGFIVNVDNVINLYQKEGLGWETVQVNEDLVTLQSAPITKGNALRSKLAEQGFAIVDGQYDQLFQVYENNDYHDFPNFVTTDLYLQAFHLYFDVMLRRAEENKFIPRLTSLCDEMHTALSNFCYDATDPKLVKAAEHAAAFFTIGHTLLTGSQSLNLPVDLMPQVSDELARIAAEDDDVSEFLNYKEAKFMYSVFRPRGHYSRSDELKRYFKAMMWLQTAPFVADKSEQLLEAALISQILTGNNTLMHLYHSIFDPITYLMGEPDNASILQIAELMRSENVSLPSLANDTKTQQAFLAKVKSLMDQQTRIVPKFQATSIYKINFMPQRFMPDALVLQEMVDYDNKPTLRGTPKGLDVFAALGMTAAERILIDELKEAENWKDYTAHLSEMKTKSDPTKWQSTVANEWMCVLTTLQADRYEQPKPEGVHPDYFMLTPQWDKKNLNALLASWAELKHDAILYAKQPMGAECGGGGPEEPVLVSYVEPNIRFWEKAIELLDKTSEVFARYDLSSDDSERFTTSLREQAEFFLNVSKKELEGKKLSDEEYRELEYIGAQFEYISLDMLKQPDQWLDDWNAVQGADKKVALVADVYTANAFNNENKSVLYEAVGPASEIYVIVEIGGNLYLTRGAVLSYREFTRPLGEPRLTDEEWQEQLQLKYSEGIPEWMLPLKVPADDIPEDNELIFYSTGC